MRVVVPLGLCLWRGPGSREGQPVARRASAVFFPTRSRERSADREPECSCWRTFGAIVGGATAFVGYVPFAMSDSRIGVSDTQRVLEWSAVTAGTAVVGYFIGKKFDRRQASGALPRGCH
jgi:hypothetical protein